MSEPLLIQYAHNILNIDRASNILAIELKEGEIVDKTGYGYLFSLLQMTYYRIKGGFEEVARARYDELLLQNWLQLSVPRPPKPKFIAMRFVDMPPTDILRVQRISREFADRIQSDQPLLRFQDFLRSTLQQKGVPPYFRHVTEPLARFDRETMALIVALAESPNLKNYQFQDPKELGAITKALDLSEKLDKVSKRFTKDYGDCKQHVTCDPVTQKLTPKDLSALTPSQAQKVATYVKIWNMLPMRELRAVKILADTMQKQPDTYLRGLQQHHLQFKRDCEASAECGRSSRILINQKKDVVPSRGQLRQAFTNAYALFSGSPSQETARSRAFFARAIQYLMVGNDIGFVQQPKDHDCFTWNAIYEVSESFPIKDHQNFLLWWIKLQQSFNAEGGGRKCIQEHIQLFFRDNIQRLPVSQLGLPNRTYNIRGSKAERPCNLTQLQRFLTDYQEDFLRYLTSTPRDENITQYAFMYLRFNKELKVDINEVLLDCLKQLQASRHQATEEAAELLLNNLNIPPALLEKYSEAFMKRMSNDPGIIANFVDAYWRFALLQFLMLTHQDTIGIQPESIHESYGNRSNRVRLGATLNDIVTPRLKQARHGFGQGAFWLEFRETPSLTYNAEFSQRYHDYPKEAPESGLVGFASVSRDIFVNDLTQLGEKAHSVYGNIRDLRVPPYALNHLAQIEQAYLNPAPLGGGSHA